MKYPDGSDICVGDRVQLANGEMGVVVFSNDRNEYSSKFPKEQWEYLKEGVMVKTDSGALVHTFGDNVNEIFKSGK